MGILADGATGAAAVAEELVTSLSVVNLWGAIIPFVGLIAVLVLFALGKRILNKNLKGAKNGTGGKV